jgi:predicted RNase H-like HicB family nuclease
MFAFRLRILDVREHEGDSPSFLGIVDGFPEVMAHAISPERVEAELASALAEHLRRLQNRESTGIEWDDFPTIRVSRIRVGPCAQ